MGAKFSYLPKLYYTYEANNQLLYLDMNGWEAGTYLRLDLNSSDLFDPYVLSSISFKQRYFKDTDSLSDLPYSMQCSHVSIGSEICVIIGGFSGFNLGFYLDILSGFKCDTHMYELKGLNRDCLNRVIPQLSLGFSLGILEMHYIVPLNSGLINLDRYAYYNRARLTYDYGYYTTISLRIHLFGSSHRR